MFKHIQTGQSGGSNLHFVCLLGRRHEIHVFSGQTVRTLRNSLDSVVVQTREHVVFECRTHEEYADIIDEGAPDHQLATLSGTQTSIDA